MKVLYINFDVGSAIEYVGGIFEDWIREIISDNELMVIEKQDPPWMIAEEIQKYKPDIIIQNEYYEYKILPLFYYKKYFPDVSLILIDHVWQRMQSIYQNIDHNEINLYNTINHIFNINHCKTNNIYNKNIFNFYYPTDPKIFNIFTPWDKREKNFIYLGNILPHKLSYEFIEKIKDTDIKIDCYGRRFDDKDEYKKYYELFDSRSENLIYKGMIPQEDVPKILNEYKYFVMPHDSFEPFNWALLQSIFCGTIPLIVNDRTADYFDSSWLDWADDLYFGCNKVDEFINNLNIVNEGFDFSKISENINQMAQKKFNYDKFKNKFQEVITEEIKIKTILKEII